MNKIDRDLKRAENKITKLERKLKPVAEQLREKIASIDFCWDNCGEIANVCKKQKSCAAFGDRHNKSYGHTILDYRRTDQILVLIKEALPELAEEAGYVKLAEDQTFPEPRMYPPEGVLIRFMQDLRKTDWRRVVLEKENGRNTEES